MSHSFSCQRVPDTESPLSFSSAGLIKPRNLNHVPIGCRGDTVHDGGKLLLSVARLIALTTIWCTFNCIYWINFPIMGTLHFNISCLLKYMLAIVPCISHLNGKIYTLRFIHTRQLREKRTFFFLFSLYLRSNPVLQLAPCWEKGRKLKSKKKEENHTERKEKNSLRNTHACMSVPVSTPGR